MFAIPLAWLQLKREKLRLLVAIAGVAFAVVLIFMQMGFSNALYDSSTRFHDKLAGEIVLISPQFPFLAQPKSFSRRRLLQARGFDGVQAVGSIYAAVTLWKNPWSGLTRTIFVVGIDPTDHVLDIPAVSSQLGRIHEPDVLLFDARARPEYGPVADALRNGETIQTEVANRFVTVGGLFELGTSFGVDGTLITSDLNFLRLFPNRNPGLIDIGVVKLRPQANVGSVQAALRAQSHPDVLVLTKTEFEEREQRYWRLSTPIGYVFTLGSLMGFIVGAIIVYQILFADVADHLAEYATLKAMGYTNRYLFGVVLQEAGILAALGYLPGIGIAIGLYQLTANATGLPMDLNPALAAFVLGVTIAMCGISGAFALRKIRSADPAEIF